MNNTPNTKTIRIKKWMPSKDNTCKSNHHKKIVLCGLFFLIVLSSCQWLGTDTPVTTTTQQPPTTTTPVVDPLVGTTMYPQYEAVAIDLLKSMSTEEKVGQLFIIRNPKADEIKSIQQYHVGGVIFFANDFATKTVEDVIAMTSSYQVVSSIPLLLGVDEEGGTVSRISKYRQFRAVPFYSPRALYAEGGWDLVVSDTVEKCNLLHRLGLNVNFAPVADVSLSANDYMYPRAFGESVEATSDYVRRIIQTMNQENIGSVTKHFPGYGNNVDTHTGIAVDERPWEQFVTIDFLPFTAAIEENAPSILVSHSIIKAIDDEFPASLSKEVHEVLRNELGFRGVVLSDDLYMDAIKAYYPFDQAAVQAIKAGNDLIISTKFADQIKAVRLAVEQGELDDAMIDQSVFRILVWKYALGLLD